MRKGSETAAKAKRPVGVVLLGVLLLAISFGLLYDLYTRKTSETVVAPSAHHYTVKQSIDTGINYFKSSFYGDTPGATNTAYVAELTDTIDATLHYSYRAERPVELTTMYSATATVRARFATGSDGKDIANVWSKEYPLVKPVTNTVTAAELEFNPQASVPFSEYRKIADQLKTSLALPATSELVVTFMVRVSGTVDGTPFDDIRMSTITVPLDQPVYKLATKFEKEDNKQVVTQAAKTGQDMMQVYERIGAAVSGALGVMALVYGMRKQIFKSPYQRELDKIYRYHSGLIIKSSPHLDLSHKTTVPVESFDDILDLEEELKSTIVASPVGGTATRFMIIHGDIVYAYLLGKIVKDEIDNSRSLEEIAAYIEGSQAATGSKKERASPLKHRRK